MENLTIIIVAAIFGYLFFGPHNNTKKPDDKKGDKKGGDKGKK